MLRPHINVLLVEDDVTIAKIVGQMLKKSRHGSYRPVHQPTLERTLEALRGGEFDVVLLDLNLPDSQGLATLDRVRETAPEVPVIVLTATTDDEVGRKAVQCGAQDFLVKGEASNLSLDRAIVYSIERHRLQRTLQQLAVLDELTGLYNRRGFNTLSPDVLQRVRAGELHGFYCCFDLDRFKQINDQQGHAKGDEALVEFASLLRASFRKDWLLARLGGDEFTALGTAPHPTAAAEAIAALRELLAARNTAGLATFQLEASAGVTVFTKADLRSLEEFSSAADTELYRDKQLRKQARAAVIGAAAAAAEERR